MPVWQKGRFVAHNPALIERGEHRLTISSFRRCWKAEDQAVGRVPGRILILFDFSFIEQSVEAHENRLTPSSNTLHSAIPSSQNVNNSSPVFVKWTKPWSNGACGQKTPTTDQKHELDAQERISLKEGC